MEPKMKGKNFEAIVIVSCHVGNSNFFPQEVADYYNIPVWTPTKRANVYEDGRISVANLHPESKIVEEFGYFKRFQPKGKVVPPASTQDAFGYCYKQHLPACLPK
jgi:hypothetical protein